MAALRLDLDGVMRAPSIPAQATGSRAEVDAVKSAPSIPVQITGSRVEADAEDVSLGDIWLSLSAFLLASGSLCADGNVGSGREGLFEGSSVRLGTTSLVVPLGQANILFMVQGLPGVRQKGVDSVGGVG